MTASDGNEVMIDLGNSEWDGEALPARRSVLVWPRLVASLAIIAALLSLTGSVRPGWQFGSVLWTLPGNNQFAIVDGVLIGWDQAGVVTARDPVTGLTRWRVDLGPSAPAYLSSVGRPGVVGLVEVSGEGTDGLTGPTSQRSVTRFVDLQTGSVLRSLTGSPIAFAADNPDVVVMDAPAAGPCKPDQACLDVAGYSFQTGERRWRLPYDPDSSTVFRLESSATFATLTEAGELTLRRLATGEPISGLHLSLGRPASAFYGYRPVQLIGDTFFAAYQGEPNSPITVVATAVGANGTSWTRSLQPLASADVGVWLSLRPCDRWLCFDDGGGSWILDPNTGDPVDRTGSNEILFSIGFGLIAHTTAPGTDAATTTITDAATGRALATVGGDVGFVFGDTPRYVIVHTTSRTQTLAQLYPDGTLRQIGVLNDIESCSTAGDVLVCTGLLVDDTHVEPATRAWRLTPP